MIRTIGLRCLSAVFYGTAAVAAASSSPALAQASFPNRSITIVVPSQPGGSIDFLARILSEPLSKALSVPVVVDNKPGASGNIGNAQVANARPDGYTLLLAYNGFLVANPHLFKTGAVNPVKDLAPVGMVSVAPQIIVSNKNLPANSVQELIQYAKAHPGKLNYASSGNGSVPHLAGELLKQRAGIEMAHIPYKGAGGAVIDLIAGQVDVYITSPAGVMQQIQAGQINALAVTGKERLDALPNVPTTEQAGLRDYEMDSWFAFYAPANTDRAVIARISSELEKVLADGQIRSRARDAGMRLVSSTPEALGRFTIDQLAYWGEVVKAAGASID